MGKYRVYETACPVWRMIVSLCVAVVVLSCSTGNKEYIRNTGRIFGTYYSVIYQQPEGVDLQEKMEERMREFDRSLSTFNRESVISRINRNDTTVRTDRYFENMYVVAERVSQCTDGAFDITVAPLVNAWGFGFGDGDRTKRPVTDTIMPYVGYRKIKLENHRLLKQDPRIMLDASAIAKGYSSDVMAALLEENGCRNYMVEIGGEVVCRGVNPKGEKWRIGINKPIDDETNLRNEIEKIVSITDAGMATSGNYRQFYYLNGKKYSHTIDPRAGIPVNHNLLSATVVAPTCMEADAFATAFMVLGKDKALELCEATPGMDCLLIYADDDGQSRVVYTDGFARYLLGEED